MNKIRVLETGSANAFWNMAVDEALMELTTLPTLRLYSWKPSAVSIGYFQSLHEEVDVNVCKSLGIDVVRRITGGGAVFHDNEITYSFVTKEYPKNIIESYKWICGAILTGLESVGIEGQFVPLNDLILNGKKFSGNAQTRKKGVLLQHGTILLGVDVDKMFSLLKVPNEKMRDKLVQNVKERVTSINVDFPTASKAIKKGFSKKFDAELVESEMTSEEVKKAEEIFGKYSSSDWNGRI